MFRNFRGINVKYKELPPVREFPKMSLTYLHKVSLLTVLICAASFFVVRFKITVTKYAPSQMEDLQRVEVLQFYSLKENKPSIYVDAYYLEIKKKFSLFDFINPKGYILGKKGENDATHFTSQRLNFNKENYNEILFLIFLTFIFKKKHEIKES